MHMHIHIHMHTHIHTHIHKHIHVRIHIHVYIYIYTRVYIYIYIYIHIYIYIWGVYYKFTNYTFNTQRLYDQYTQHNTTQTLNLTPRAGYLVETTIKLLLSVLKS